MAKYLARIMLLGAQSIGRAFVKAIRQEIQASQEAAHQHQAISAKSSNRTNDVPVKGMTLHEAQQILNVKDLSNSEDIQCNYKHLFAMNEKSTGGSFYLQSKVFRAKERLDRELRKLATQPKQAPEPLQKQQKQE
ncbi:blp [Drosophila busckii]|uniref:Blp n=1 Tax=Drosophila busckii TaxID=30019 RepID=A0A0M4ENS0_DROBS|nr:mitochondrial import inner membrane translocase subunit TIM16 [Drosophila busckii]ALC49721.1 blp [Drosophila busckii]